MAQSKNTKKCQQYKKTGHCPKALSCKQCVEVAPRVPLPHPPSSSAPPSVRLLDPRQVSMRLAQLQQSKFGYKPREFRDQSRKGSNPFFGYMMYPPMPGYPPPRRVSPPKIPPSIYKTSSSNLSQTGTASDSVAFKKAQATKIVSKTDTCVQCNRRLPLSILFCNPLCADHFCYECSQEVENCKFCKVKVDTEDAKSFFRTYCTQCQNVGCGIADKKRRICGMCLTQEEKRSRHNDQKRQLTPNEKQAMTCSICMDKQKNYCCFPCGHMEYCEDCIKQVIKDKKCAKCAGAVTFTHKIYY